MTSINTSVSRNILQNRLSIIQGDLIELDFLTSSQAEFTYIAICNKAMICLRYIINVFLIIQSQIGSGDVADNYIFGSFK
ncbi:hypothetical protein NIES267_60320 [Calothrix parasitica NIES-267]|uniref:Uncharacterized protein n=1 Tax=Calothrix parasitica NIES-267 TaxID=1973488 RepID=A0A1Z4LZ63_9CYAN|nr:hypothetical protein NIES267_60320 [Calothrix parasitica NIES-267]